MFDSEDVFNTWKSSGLGSLAIRSFTDMRSPDVKGFAVSVTVSIALRCWMTDSLPQCLAAARRSVVGLVFRQVNENVLLLSSGAFF